MVTCVNSQATSGTGEWHVTVVFTSTVTLHCLFGHWLSMVIVTVPISSHWPQTAPFIYKILCALSMANTWHIAMFQMAQSTHCGSYYCPMILEIVLIHIHEWYSGNTVPFYYKYQCKIAITNELGDGYVNTSKTSPYVKHRNIIY